MFVSVACLAAAQSARAAEVPPVVTAGQKAEIPWSANCPASPPLAVPKIPHTRAALATNQPVVIVALGSSSTRGWMATDVAHSYPAQLQRYLEDHVPRLAPAVINRGIGGQDAPEELARLDTDVLAAKPSLVIWQAGANFALHGADPVSFKQLMVAGVRRLKAAGTDVILMDNQRSPRILAATDHVAMEAAMADVAAETQVNLFPRGALMDAWAAAGEDMDDFVAPDGLHMNNRGYVCLARALGDVIAAALRQPLALQQAPLR